MCVCILDSEKLQRSRYVSPANSGPLFYCHYNINRILHKHHSVNFCRRSHVEFEKFNLRV